MEEEINSKKNEFESNQKEILSLKDNINEITTKNKELSLEKKNYQRK